ncbi:hypothetical protein [Mesorhizobium japonicum]|uniref:Mlr5463 protein n=1 Tax=Mesorhizobium japonicum (strain LMG 29417 / CECT 9101 / MAFF 303099) TaxID=266835 RepID=Q98BR1_RHILO|nr:hypothetical protein [Mesorhizobium japonicum]BAB51911.1 mlr5463 [Mesorhizobium japonicum MAFF 303099]
MIAEIDRGELFLDETTIRAIRILWRGARWRIFPYGVWIEPDGAAVIFDRAYRPICRVRRRNEVEIVPPDQWINFKRQRWFWDGWTHPKDSAETREKLIAIVARYGLEPELRRRRDLERRGLLPRWAERPASKRSDRQEARHA